MAQTEYKISSRDFLFHFMQEVVVCMVNTVGLQWLEPTGAMKISSGQRKLQPSRISFYTFFIQSASFFLLFCFR